MRNTELEYQHSLESKVELKEKETGYEILTPSYSLSFHNDTPFIDLFDAQGLQWMQLFKGSQIVTSQNHDVTYGFEKPTYEHLDDGSIAVRIQNQSEHDTFKEQVWICHASFVETFITAEASGALQRITLLGGTIVDQNMFGTSMSQRHFQNTYNPQPNESERPAISAFESTRITTSGMWKPGRRREFLITPFTYGFNMRAPGSNNELPEGDWLMAGVSAPIEDQNMVDYRYEVQEDGFSLTLTYDSTNIEGPFVHSPSLLLHFAPDPLNGLQDFKHHAQDIHHLKESIAPVIPAWHHDSTFVTWGHQLEHERRLSRQGIAVRARDALTEPFVNQALRTLEDNNVSIGKIVLDDKWQTEYGTNTPDLYKWPDMARFIQTQHMLGRHILLWMKLFDPGGLPPELCILDSHGRPIASDPTNPEYIDVLRHQVRTLISPDQLDADGLKLDFLAQLPHGPGLRWHGTQRGHAALHNLMKNIYEEVRGAKSDALIEAQVVSPWFSDTMNHVRLNDTNERHSITRTMGERARLSFTLLPDHPIDPDGWPVRDIPSWLQYIKIQPELTGTMTTHFVDSVNGERLTNKDFEVLAQTAQKVQSDYTR